MSDWAARARSRLWHAIGIGQVTTAPNDTGPVQKMQVQLSPLQTMDGVPNVQQFGFTSVPPVGSDVVTVSHAGEPSNSIVIAVGHQTYRLKGLATGDAAIYDMRGAKVVLTAGGIIIDGAGQEVKIQNAPTVTMDVALLRVQGDIIDNYGSNANNAAGMRTIFNTHTHPEHDGGDTSAPNETM